MTEGPDSFQKPRAISAEWLLRSALGLLALPMPFGSCSPASGRAGLWAVCSQKLPRRVCCKQRCPKELLGPWTKVEPESGPKCSLFSLTSHALSS